MVRIKAVVGDSNSEFSRKHQPEGYAWRFDNRSPGGHLFDDMIHKFAAAPWIVDTEMPTRTPDPSDHLATSSIA